jgi:hypothetical protein
MDNDTRARLSTEFTELSQGSAIHRRVVAAIASLT